MKLSVGDPKLTAYALGELDASERAEVERELANSPECRDAVEEIRQMAGLLSEGLANEPAPRLTEAQRAIVVRGIAEAPKPANVVPFPRRRLLATLGIAAAAASITAVLVLRDPDNHKNSPNLALNHPALPANDVTNGLPTTNASNEIARLVQDGKLLFELRKFNEAEAKLNRALRIDPNNKVAEYYLQSVKRSQNSHSISEKLTNADPYEILSVLSNVPDTTVTYNQSIGNGGMLSSRLTSLQSYIDFSYDTSTNGYALTRGEIGGPMQLGEEYRWSNSHFSSQVPYVVMAGNSGDVDGDGKYDGGKLGVVAPGTFIRSTAATPKGFWAFDSTSNQKSYVFLDGHVDGDGIDAYVLLQDGTKQPVTVEFTENPKDGTKQVIAVGSLEGQEHKWYSVAENGTASYPHYFENKFISPYEQALSTFSIDVDTASYANMRRFLNQGQLPPRDAVRIEELINYFPYRYPQPKGDDAFQANIEIAGCPWAPEHRLVRIGIKGKEIAREKRPASNFVFLIDVSGSMQPSERLPLIKQALRMLVKKMTESDRVAIVVYASEAGVKLQSTSCANKERILEVIDALEAGGSTNGGEGIQQAYAVATQNFIKDGVNRVLLCTDGDFNVGITDQSDLIKLVQDKAKSGVFLTTIGVGTDNYKDATMQKLADKGNGNYYYLDTLEEAQKVLIEQMNGTLVTIAKDVKIQVEFNPAVVDSYRLIGYEKRLLRKQDFNDDTKDAGEIGAGHTITALYEVVPAGAQVQRVVDNLKYQPAAKPERYAVNNNKEMLTLKLRFKKPDGDKSSLLEFPVTDMEAKFDRASQDFRFAAAVAEFGLILKDSQFKGNATLGSVKEIAESSKGDDEHGYRAEFINLVKKAAELKK